MAFKVSRSQLASQDFQWRGVRQVEKAVKLFFATGGQSLGGFVHVLQLGAATPEGKVDQQCAGGGCSGPGASNSKLAQEDEDVGGGLQFGGRCGVW